MWVLAKEYRELVKQKAPPFSGERFLGKRDS
jgi:hypothetical protein